MNVTIINAKALTKKIIRLTVFFIITYYLIDIVLNSLNSVKDANLFKLCSSIYTNFFNNITYEKIDYDNINLNIVSLFYPLIKIDNNTYKTSSEQITYVNTENISSTTIEAVSENNISESYNICYKDVKIKNQSSYNLTDEILSYDNLNITKNKKILIYHTHTCESYTPSEKYSYEMTGNYRTTDKNFNVVRLGEELTNILKDRGYDVIHNTTYHDYPSYNGSYDRSLVTIENILKQNPDIYIIIDIHRDAVGDGISYGPSVMINGQKVAQMMLVIGTDGGGLEHPNWIQNVKSGIKLQSSANSIYPGLFRPIIIRNSRYNQHVAPAAWIIEVGATGNTLDECINSMKYLANVIEKTF